MHDGMPVCLRSGSSWALGSADSKEHMHWCENVRHTVEGRRNTEENRGNGRKKQLDNEKLLVWCAKDFKTSLLIRELPKIEEHQKKKRENTEWTSSYPRGLLSYRTLNTVTSCLLVRRVTDTTLFTSSRNTTPVYLTTCSVFLHLTQPWTCWSVRSSVMAPCGQHYSRHTETQNLLLVQHHYDTRLASPQQYTCKL